MATVAFATPHASLPLAFEKNAGQTQDSVRYFGRTPGAELWLTDSGAVLAVDQKDRRAVLRMTIVGARPHPQIEGSAQLAGYASYFTGNDESRWRTHVPLFERVRYHDTYPGIDLVFHGQAQTLEYDWVVSPGADPRAIRMSFRGANEMRIDATGDLVLEISGLEIRQKRPHIYQAGREIGGRFSRRGHAIGFEVDSYDPSQALTIDPVVSYASYLGTAANDSGYAIAIDPNGFLLLAGNTNSPAFPTKNGLFASSPNSNGYAFIAKFAPTASGNPSLVWLTLLGGSYFDVATAIASDAQGNVLVAGYTQSGNFPVKNAFQPTLASTFTCSAGALCPDAFVTKITSAGDALVYSSYLGGDRRDYAYGIAVDSTGNAWVAGYTKSDNFNTTPSAYQKSLNGAVGTAENGFITGISPAGSLLYSTLLGGEAQDHISGTAVDSQGNVYVTGQTYSTKFPTVNPFQAALVASADGFVAKLNPAVSGTAGLVYSTYLGGSGGLTNFNVVAADAQGNIYVAGGTNAPNYPVTPQSAIGPKIGGTPNASDPNSQNLFQDAVVTKLNPALQGPAQLAYSSYLGGSAYEVAWGIGVDSKGRILVAGETDSPDFPVTADGFQHVYSGAQYSTKAFISMIDPSIQGAEGLVYSSYYGGSSNDVGFSLALNATSVAIAGTSASSNTPVTPSAYQPNNAGGQGDAFVALFDLTQSGPAIFAAVNAASFLPAGGGASPGEMVTLFGNLLGPATLEGSVLDTAGKLPTTVAGCQVLVNGTPAPIVYVWTKQTSVILPYELTPNIRQTDAVFAQVICNNVPGNLFPLQIVSSAPGIFSAGNGQAAVLNADGSANSEANPAAKGSIIQIFGTGEGVLTPAGEDGRIENGPVSAIPKPVLPVSVTFANIASPQITYAGVAPQAVDGLVQVDAQIPSNVPSGNIAIVLTVGSASSQPGLTVAVK